MSRDTSRRRVGDAPTPDGPQLRRTPYPLWLIGDTATESSRSILNFAIPLIALSVTGSPAHAGVIAAVTIVGRAVAPMIGGVMADRHSRGRIMVVGAIVSTALSATFTALAWGESFTFITLMCTSVVMAFSTSLFTMAAAPMLKDILPASAVGRAQAANQGRDAAIGLAGGPAGGVLLGIGAWAVGVVMIVLDAIAVIATLALHHRTRIAHSSRRPDGPRRSPARDFAEAFSWLWRRRDLMNLLVIVLLINLGLGVIMATTIYALQQRGTDPFVIGLISAAAGAGMLAGALAAGWIVENVATGTVTVVALSTVSVATASLAVIEAPLGVGVVMFAACLVVPAVNAAIGGYTMVATPSAMLGRVNGAQSTLAGIVAPLAPLIAGFGLSAWGRTPTVLIGVAVTVASVLIMLATKPTRTIPQAAQWEAHAAAYGR